MGPAARAGDKIQITHVSFEGDKLLLDVNGGLTNGHWYDHISGGVGGGTGQTRGPDDGGYGPAPTTGTYLRVIFRRPLEALTSADVKGILAPIMTFDSHSATQLFSRTLSPEMQKAISEKKALAGMTRDEVKLALGAPDNKYRQTTKDGVDTEDWIYGKGTGKYVFVTFAGNKAITVKETYAGLGGDTVQR